MCAFFAGDVVRNLGDRGLLERAEYDGLPDANLLTADSFALARRVTERRDDRELRAGTTGDGELTLSLTRDRRETVRTVAASRLRRGEGRPLCRGPAPRLPRDEPPFARTTMAGLLPVEPRLL